MTTESLREQIERLARALALSAHGCGLEGMTAPPKDAVERTVTAIEALIESRQVCGCGQPIERVCKFGHPG